MKREERVCNLQIIFICLGLQTVVSVGCSTPTAWVEHFNWFNIGQNNGKKKKVLLSETNKT